MVILGRAVGGYEAFVNGEKPYGGNLIMHGLNKLKMAQAFLESADIVGVVFLNKGASMDDQILDRKKVCHFLYAMIFELVLKALWEVENGKECEHHHRILEVYKELSREKQLRIRELYNAQTALIKNQEDLQRKGNGERVDHLTEFQSLKDALEANFDTITNFTYEGLFHGKSSVIEGVIWNEDEELIYIFPQRYAIFPKELLSYARECVDSQLLSTIKPSS